MFYDLKLGYWKPEVRVINKQTNKSLVQIRCNNVAIVCHIIVTHEHDESLLKVYGQDEENCGTKEITKISLKDFSDYSLGGLNNNMDIAMRSTETEHAIIFNIYDY